MANPAARKITPKAARIIPPALTDDPGIPTYEQLLGQIECVLLPTRNKEQVPEQAYSCKLAATA